MDEWGEGGNNFGAMRILAFVWFLFCYLARFGRMGKWAK